MFNRTIGMLALLFIMMLTPPLVAAPAPLAPRRAAAPATLPALCVMRWAGTDYVTHFYAGGRYDARQGDLASAGPDSPLWRGTWRLEGRMLHVRERREEDPRQLYPWFEWSVELDARLREGGHVVLSERSP